LSMFPHNKQAYNKLPLKRCKRAVAGLPHVSSAFWNVLRGTDEAPSGTLPSDRNLRRRERFLSRGNKTGMSDAGKPFEQ
jgi:hypothetical protein